MEYIVSEMHFHSYVAWKKRDAMSIMETQKWHVICSVDSVEC